MNIAIIASEKNVASMSIRKKLLDNYPFADKGTVFRLADGSSSISLHTFEEELLYLDGLERKIDADIFIFPSTHRSKAGINSLSVHCPGNWGKADLGGEDRKLCIAHSILMKLAFLRVQNHELRRSLEVDVFMESTHHGPLIEKPCMFIEIGSDETMYRNETAAKIIADSIIRSLQQLGSAGLKPAGFKSAIGIGGTHYCENFRKALCSPDWAIGHVCPKYALGRLDKEMLLQAVDRTIPVPEAAIVDWKGLGAFKEHVKRILEENGIKIIKTSSF